MKNTEEMYLLVTLVRVKRYKWPSTVNALYLMVLEMTDENEFITITLFERTSVRNEEGRQLRKTSKVWYLSNRMRKEYLNSKKHTACSYHAMRSNTTSPLSSPHFALYHKNTGESTKRNKMLKVLPGTSWINLTAYSSHIHHNNNTYLTLRLVWRLVLLLANAPQTDKQTN